MIRNYLPLIWKLLFVLAVVLLVVNYYGYTHSGNFDTPMQWLFLAMLFMSIIIRFISEKNAKQT